jgi:hypothetical protein
MMKAQILYFYVFSIEILLEEFRKNLGEIIGKFFLI